MATKGDLRELEQQLDARFEALERQFSRMVTRLGILVVVRIGILLIAIAGLVGGIGGVLYYWK